MAKLFDEKGLLALLKKEEKALRVKRKQTKDPDWMPAGRAGVMPEKVWKKYSPKSKTVSSYKAKK